MGNNWEEYRLSKCFRFCVLLTTPSFRACPQVLQPQNVRGKGRVDGPGPVGRRVLRAHRQHLLRHVDLHARRAWRARTGPTLFPSLRGANWELRKDLLGGSPGWAISLLPTFQFPFQEEQGWLFRFCQNSGAYPMRRGCDSNPPPPMCK